MLLAAPGSGPARARPRILLVEDHADTRLMYQEFLGLEYDVVAAADGVAAVAAVRERTPDLIITDLSLPRMDGFELIRQLQADERFARIPIIALSGYSGTEHEERVRQAGTATILQKPCLPEALSRQVEAHLRRRS